MRVTSEALREVEAALAEWDKEVAQAVEEGRLKASSGLTYHDYGRDFVRWLKGEFVPGGGRQM